MKSRVILINLSLLFIFLLLIIPNVYGNPVAAYTGIPYYIIWLFLVIIPIMILGTFFIESGVYYFFLRHNMKSDIVLFEVVFDINVLTVPITQMFAYALGTLISNNPWIFIVIESIIVLVEYGLFTKKKKKF